MPTISFNSTHLVTHRNNTYTIGRFRQGIDINTESGSGTAARNCAHAFWDASAINSALNGMIIDGVSITIQSTTSYGYSATKGFYLYKSPYAYSETNSYKLSPNEYNPGNSFYVDGEHVAGYVYTTPLERSSSDNITSSLPLDFLQNVRDGKGLAAYRRTVYSTPTVSENTRETTEPLILNVTYHAPASDFTLNKSSVNAGESITVTVTPTDFDYSHRVTWRLNSTYQQVNTIAANSNPATNQYTVAMNWCNAIPGTSIGCTCKVETMSGSTVLGSITKNFTVTVPSSVVPSFSSLSIDYIRDKVPSGWDIYVQGKSKATVSIIGASGIYGSTITGYNISGYGSPQLVPSYTTGNISVVAPDPPRVTYQTSQPTGSIFGELWYDTDASPQKIYKWNGSSWIDDTASWTVTFTGIITDSRGRTFSRTGSIFIHPYVNPTIAITSYAKRCISDGTLNDLGQSVKCLINYSYSGVNGNNTISLTKIEYKLTSNTTWTLGYDGEAGHSPILASGDSVIVGGDAVNYTLSYNFLFTISDAFGSATRSISVLSSNFTYHEKAGGDGAAFGKTSEISNTLEISPEWYLRAYGQTIGVPSNPNLLIGGNFSTNPWQMGSGPFTSIGYGADKWRQNATDMTVSKNGDNLRVVNSNVTTRRILHNFTEVGIVTGNTYTLSICTAAGAIYSGHVVANTTARQDVDFTGGHSISLEYFSGLGLYAFCIIVAANSTLDVAWCKAEIGTVYTPEIPRPKQQELAMCQRELYILGGGAYEKFCIGMYSTATQASIVIKPPVRMRVAPTPVLTGNFSLSGTVLAGGTFSNDGSTTDTICIKNTSVSGKTPGYSFLMYANNDTSARIINDAQIYP